MFKNNWSYGFGYSLRPKFVRAEHSATAEGENCAYGPTLWFRFMPLAFSGITRLFFDRGTCEIQKLLGLFYLNNKISRNPQKLPWTKRSLVIFVFLGLPNSPYVTLFLSACVLSVLAS